eukprot:363887-Chlamydomonas_euryale.AAC.9
MSSSDQETLSPPGAASRLCRSIATLSAQEKQNRLLRISGQPTGLVGAAWVGRRPRPRSQASLV